MSPVGGTHAHCVHLLIECLIMTRVFPSSFCVFVFFSLAFVVNTKLLCMCTFPVEGHDSSEDASACMELMVWKIKEDAKVKR